jgi:DNA polymerase elongation subunit (family B)
MGDVLLSASNAFVYHKDSEPVPARTRHRPFFWAFAPAGRDVKELRRHVLEAVQFAQGKDEAEARGNPLSAVVEVGPLEEVESFWRSQRRLAFRVYTRHPGLVPSVSDALFLAHGAFTAEHDVPYQQRLVVDLAARGEWPYATGGKKTTLNVTVFDIETTQYGNEDAPAGDNLPIDVIGWSDFPFTYQASVDLETERFDLDILDAPQDWAAPEVVQEVALTEDDEVQLLTRFIKKVESTDVLSGHNIYGFDNLKIHDRVKFLLEKGRRKGTLGRDEEATFARFLDTWSWRDKSYQFGRPDDVAYIHRTGLDTLLAARRFYFYRDDFTLKGLAPFIGVNVEGRQYMTPEALDVRKKETLLYHVHDIREQLGMSMHFMVQALPLAFSTGMPFEQLFSGMNTKMWDHIGLIRAAHRKRLMPATCRAQSVAGTIQRRVGPPYTMDRIAKAARNMGGSEGEGQSAREFLRVAKYGEEMPEWVEYPDLITNVDGVGEEPNGYAIPGGMTLHPSQMGSDFIPWWKVVAADVGAMYPTILKALNVGADTVRVARKGETPDAWAWLYRASPGFLDSGEFVVRKPNPDEGYATRGVMIGIKKRADPGVVNLGMTAIMGMIQKTKAALGEAKRGGKDPELIRRLQLNYQSLKAARNAGTHGILVAVNVSCRQFHVLAGAHITTEGQRILHASLEELKEQKIRVVYGDSIAGDRCVVVRDPKRLLRVMPIERLYDEVQGESHPWNGKEAVLVDGWDALAMSPETGESSWRKIRRVIRHDTHKPLVRFRQKDGETVCTTDHSLMVRDGDRIVEAAPEQAMDRPLVRVPIPPNPVLHEIDLLDYIEPLATRLEGEIPPNRLFSQPRKTLWFRYDDDWLWFDLHTRPDLPILRLRRRISVGSPECSALCRLLGAYVAEGSVTWIGSRRGAAIATADEAWLTSLKADYDLLFQGPKATIIASDVSGDRTIMLTDGRQTTYVDTTKKLQMTNMVSAAALWALGGKGSAGKCVPDFLFNLPAGHQREFLDSAVRGDGSHAWGPRYSERHRVEHFNYTTKSLQLASGICTLLGQLGIDYSVKRRASKGVYTITTRGASRASLHSRMEPVEHEGPVYDLEVEADRTFVDALGTILLHNTDGIYLACGKNGANLPEIAKVYDAQKLADEKDWLTPPDAAVRAVEALNDRFRRELDYEDFELEAEIHDCMVFVVHKNYLIFDAKDGELVMETKGNNFKGADKPDLARVQLARIMKTALGENLVWKTEEGAQKSLKSSIKRATTELIQDLRVATADPRQLTLLQTVRPAQRYKPNPDGTQSAFAKRSEALSKLLEKHGLDPVRAARKLHFVVANRPLPGMETAGRKKPGIKPMEFMWPVEILGSKEWRDQGYHIDLEWYKEMIANYVKGAFGFDDLSTVETTRLDQWL